MTAVVPPALVPFDVEPGTLFFTSPSSESDDPESELGSDSSDSEDSGDDFDVGDLTLDFAFAFGLGELGFFGWKGVTFALEYLSLLGFRELVSESVSENEMSPFRDGEDEKCANLARNLTLLNSVPNLPKLAWTYTCKPTRK